MKTRLLLVLVLLSFTASGLAQKPAKKPATLAQRFIVKKQVLVDDLELQLKDIPYAAVRIYIRYKLAEWLWKKGPDDTTRAEALAVRALEEAYAKKDELMGSQRYKLVTDLAERIQRREARIVADMVLAIDALESAQKEAEKKEAAEKKPAPAKP